MIFLYYDYLTFFKISMRIQIQHHSNDTRPQLCHHLQCRHPAINLCLYLMLTLSSGYEEEFLIFFLEFLYPLIILEIL